jgi:hypothetical protein
VIVIGVENGKEGLGWMDGGGRGWKMNWCDQVGLLGQRCTAGSTEEGMKGDSEREQALVVWSRAVRGQSEAITSILPISISFLLTRLLVSELDTSLLIIAQNTTL